MEIVTRCLNCGNALSDASEICPQCGEAQSGSELEDPPQQRAPFQINALVRAIAYAIRRFFAWSSSAYWRARAISDEETVHIWGSSRPDLITASLEPLGEPLPLEEANRELPVLSHATWHKVVETPSSHPPVVYPPKPPQSPLSHPAIQRVIYWRRRMPPAIMFWVSIIVLIVLLGAGTFGITRTLGKSLHLASAGALSLQVSPQQVAIGAMITLRGANFAPSGHIGLTYDASIPIVDTGGAFIIRADSQGKFTDTALVGADWGNGPHTITAEDAFTHKTIAFPIMVTGHGSDTRPAHLKVSVNALDLGSGDLATNTTRTISLTNSGSGQVSWQGTSSQPWLVMSPNSGTFSSAMHPQVAIAVDRSNLKPGSYTAQILFSSNVGNVVLPISMQVIPLQVSHEAVLQLTSAVLSFNATDGGPAPASQHVTVANPGVLPLHWQASSNQSWLTVGPQTGTVQASNSQSVTVGVNTSTMLPGTYVAKITFAGQGSDPVSHSPQSIYVSVTIAPQCSLQVSPSILTFSSAFQQAAPAAKTVNLASAADCTTPMQWSATSNASWITLGTANGTTPSTVAISINVAGLSPGTYNSSVTFNSSNSTFMLLVSFMLGQPAAPVMSIAQSSLNFDTIIGQGSPAAQTAALTNPGGSTLSWQVATTTNLGGSWLSVTPSSGSLAPNQTVILNVSTMLLNALVPTTYTGVITIKGTDRAGRAATGNPQVLPINFVVKAACAVVATPNQLTFNTIAGQADPSPQGVQLKVSGTCANSLTWTVSTGTTAWLHMTTTTGTVSSGYTGTINVGVSLAGLTAGPPPGTVTIIAQDSVTHAVIGSPQNVSVTLNVSPPCSLQAPSSSGVNFSSEAGVDPAPQMITVGVNGTCSGNVTITPTIPDGATWVGIGPASVSVASGDVGTFSIKVSTTGLAVGTHTDTIFLAANTSGGIMTGSPQPITITLVVVAAPALTVNQTPIVFNVTTGQSTVPVTIGNAGASPLNWSASLASGAPAFLSLSLASGSGLAGGANTAFNLVVNATGVASGGYTTNVQISATDAATNTVVAGSPVTIPITVNVAPPAMQISSTNLTFSTTEGSNPATQSLVITNTGGGTLAWTASAPSQPWLSVNQLSNADQAGGSSTLIFTVNAAGLTASGGPYNDQVTITPSAGAAVTVAITLNVATNATPTASPASPSGTDSSTPTPVPLATPESTPIETPTRQMQRLK